jgi:glyoxalase family protein
MSGLEGTVKGLHHITLVTSNQEVNTRFYTEVLGMRRVKLTVNQDDIYHRHLFYADDKGTTGSAITFFEWPGLTTGRVGLGSPHHLAYNVTRLEAIPRWKAWLISKGVSVVGPLMRNGRLSLYLRDPDGVLVEIASQDTESVTPEYLQELDRELPRVQEIGPEMRLTTFNHATPITSDSTITVRFFDKLLGLKNFLNHPNPDQEGTSIAAIGNDELPDFFRYLESGAAHRGEVGQGNIHHIAMAVEGDEEQRKILRRLQEVGIRNSGIIDRFWFKSLYFRDPDGNLLEVATKTPGYTADEPLDKLGTSLVLPKWLERSRTEIETFLRDTDARNHAVWPPSFQTVESPPEALPEPSLRS